MRRKKTRRRSEADHVPLSLSVPFFSASRLLQGIIDNQTLGYFIARIHLFLTAIGIDPTRLRFRQHMANEMAHYAADCWDAEIQSSYGWIECVGCADRSAYDLTVHANKTKQRLAVQQTLAEPIVVTKLTPAWDKKVVGVALKREAGVVTKFVDELSEEELKDLKEKLEGPNA